MRKETLNLFFLLLVSTHVIASLPGNTFDDFYAINELILDKPDSAKTLGYRQIELLKAENNNEQLGKIYYLMGKANYYISRLDSALIYHNMALTLLESKSDSVFLLNIYLNLANTYADMSNYTEAVKFYEKTFQLGEKLQDEPLLTSLRINLSQTFSEQENYPLALEQLKMALDLLDTNDYARSFKVFNEFALCYLKSNDIEKAKDFINKASRLKDKVGDVLETCNHLAILAKYESSFNKVQEAENLYLKSIGLLKNYGDPFSLAVEYARFSLLKSKMNQKDSALHYALLSEGLAERIPSLWVKKKSLEALYLAYRNAENFEKSLDYLGKYLEVSETMTNQRFEIILRLDEQKLETQKLQSIQAENILKTQALKRSNIFVSILFVAFIIILGSMFLANKKRIETALINKDLLLKNQQIKEQSEIISKASEDILEKNKELSNLNEEKNKMLSMLTHDFRAPIHQLMAIIDIYFQDLLSEDEVRDVMKRMQTAISGISETTENLLKWSQNVYKSKSEIIEKFEIKELLQSIENQSSFLLKSKNISLNHEITSENLMLSTDKNKLEIILRNLINNAIKYSFNGSEVRISSRLDRDHVEIKIKDTSVGMPIEILDKINNKRTIKSTPGTNNEQGLGIGLFLVRDLLENMGGTLNVVSFVNVGTTFSIYLPETQS